MAISPWRLLGQQLCRITAGWPAVPLIVAASALLLSCSVLQAGEELPTAVRDAAAGASSVARLATDADLDPEMVAFVRTHQSVQHLSWVRADLDADGRADFACLVMSSVVGECELALAVVLQQSAGTVTVLPAVRLGTPCVSTGANAPRVEVYLRSVQAGTRVAQTEAVPNAKATAPVTLTADGVEVVYFERSARVFFLDGGQLRSIWTAD